jgi:hypothetical protein
MMSGRAVWMTCAAAAAVALGACRPPASKATPTDVAWEYYGHLRDGEMAEAEELCFFEDERAEKAWIEQIGAYLRLREAGQPAWWGAPFREHIAAEEGQDATAIIDVQWFYPVSDGWMMGPKYTYRMKKPQGGWRMWISTDETKRGVPFVPPPLSESDGDDDEDE